MNAARIVVPLVQVFQDGTFKGYRNMHDFAVDNGKMDLFNNNLITRNQRISEETYTVQHCAYAIYKNSDIYMGQLNENNQRQGFGDYSFSGNVEVTDDLRNLVLHGTWESDTLVHLHESYYYEGERKPIILFDSQRATINEEIEKANHIQVSWSSSSKWNQPDDDDDLLGENAQDALQKKPSVAAAVEKDVIYESADYPTRYKKLYENLLKQQELKVHFCDALDNMSKKKDKDLMILVSPIDIGHRKFNPVPILLREIIKLIGYDALKETKIENLFDTIGKYFYRENTKPPAPYCWLDPEKQKNTASMYSVQAILACLCIAIWKSKDEISYDDDEVLYNYCRGENRCPKISTTQNYTRFNYLRQYQAVVDVIFFLTLNEKGKQFHINEDIKKNLDILQGPRYYMHAMCEKPNNEAKNYRIRVGKCQGNTLF